MFGKGHPTESKTHHLSNHNVCFSKNDYIAVLIAIDQEIRRTEKNKDDVVDNYYYQCLKKCRRTMKPIDTIIN